MLLMEKASLYAMQGTLSAKKEQITQLKACKSELKSIKEEFTDSKSTIKKPEFSTNTWQGSLADSFKYIRNDMKATYDDIEGKQFDHLLDKINERIASIEDEIQSLSQDISSLKNTIERLEKEEKEARH
ncbi:DUF5082 domain-containing protein [Bacillus atrophaeus]|uniref:YwqH-like family protein n=1 Tax=Bacillus atrophaeus TaxID=1452 RepID=UPI002281A12A|nr:DUF5082 family protein [Bacillus atrophaeus]MCY8484887.1 DUF5082 domain-containing protein [Bacillus atrophaeus]